MLDLDRIDLRALAEALEDHSETVWALDPSTGAVEAFADAAPEDWVTMEPLPSHVGYEDMEAFASRVRDAGARDRLERALGGRGAFRRFKDALIDFPELRKAWFAYHDTHMKWWAIRRLAKHDLITEEQAERAQKGIRMPPLPPLAEAFHAEAIARAVAKDLRELYGGRLRDVILYGSAARGEAHEESDLDLLIVLDEMTSPFEEIDRMSEVMWKHVLEHHLMISGQPFSEGDFIKGDSRFLRNIRRDGRTVL